MVDKKVVYEEVQFVTPRDTHPEMETPDTPHIDEPPPRDGMDQEFMALVLESVEGGIERRGYLPEHRLLLALLERAYLDLREDLTTQGLAREARYFVEDNSLQPFSFLWVCSHLNLSPALVRDGLSRLQLL